MFYSLFCDLTFNALFCNPDDSASTDGHIVIVKSLFEEIDLAAPGAVGRAAFFNAQFPE